MPTARVLAQAKINVYLRVIGRRPDGYHNLDTLFHRIDLADEVAVRARTDARCTLDCAGPALPPEGLGHPTANLAYRAAALYAKRTGWPRGFGIELTKHIPVGAGLGGGSADAGAVLRALNALAPLPLDPAELLALGLQLGSDVPFLTSEDVCAHGSERGGSLVIETPPPRADVLLIIPPFSIATGDAYRWLSESGDYDSGSSQPRIGATSRSAWAAWDFGNTFERALEPRFPELESARERLAAAGAVIARLSGSGSTVFGIFDPKAPDDLAPGTGNAMIRTTTSSHVVQVEVRE